MSSSSDGSDPSLAGKLAAVAELRAVAEEVSRHIETVVTREDVLRPAREALAAAEKKKQLGNDGFRKGDFLAAYAEYMEAHKALDVASAEPMTAYAAEVLRLTVLANTAQCALKTGQPSAAANFCRDAVKLSVWVQGWGRERQPIGSRCSVRGARAAASRRREPHKNHKQRTLQPPTLNPSAVVVFSRCHREVRGDASHRGWSTRRCVPSSTTRRVVKMTEAGVHRPVRALRGSVRGRHLGGHVVARGGGWWARRPARADASVLWSMSQAPRPRT